MDSLKLGLAGLPEAEGNLIATLFRLHAVERSFIWTLKKAPPYDALLIDASFPEEATLPLRGRNTSIMRLSAPGQQTPGEMHRPIRSDRLISWLNSIEVGLLHGGHDAFASTASHSVIGASSFESAAARPAASSMPGALRPGTIDLSDETLAYKLKRWPPASALAKNVGRIRVATVLSRKPITIKELVALSRIAADDCEAFLQTLAQHHLLAIERRASEPRAAAPINELPPLEAMQKTEKRGRFDLVRSIRRRFGLL